MKRIFDFLVSTKATVIFLILFALACAAATFIEQAWDTVTAKILVYNALWFELLLLLLAINFIGNIKRYNLLRREKLGSLTFHLAFVLLILGSGVTRYTGFEGSMHIREGEYSDVILSENPFFQVNVSDNGKNYTKEKELLISGLLDNSFNFNINTESGKKLQVKYKKFIYNAVESVQENQPGGTGILELSVFINNHLKNYYIKDGEVKLIGSKKFAFNNEKADAAFKFFSQNGRVYFKSAGEISRIQMKASVLDTFPKDSVVEIESMYFYKSEGNAFTIAALYQNAKIVYFPGEEGQVGEDAVIVDVISNNETVEVPVFGGNGYVNNFQNININGLDVQLAYGNKTRKTDFKIQLNDFILDRYSGSMSPSSFASEVTLIDEQNGINENHRIFMNNVLDYDGYRFFQSSYDQDEMGTVLSVNHDFWGTWISYAGYFLLMVGFVFALIAKKSRFMALNTNIQNLRTKRKKGLLTILFLIGFSFAGFAQKQNIVNAEHAEKFGNLIVQTYDGRFQPIHTLAIDVLHKISRKDAFDLPGKGKINDMQAFIDMHLDPEYWKQQKIVYVREEAVRKKLGIDGKYARFNDFFDENFNYKLAEYAEIAFRKRQGEQNTFDKEIIKLDERLNICMMVFQGNLLKIFPEPDSHNHHWCSYADSAAYLPITGPLKMINADLQLKELTFRNMMALYFTSVTEAMNTGDYTHANKIIGYFSNIQRESDAKELIPSETKIAMEVHYNKANIFIFLRNFYAIISFVLIFLAFIESLETKKNKWLHYALNIFIGLLAFGFLYHTYGMGLRWYLSGHAPWSNGYEALLLVSWGGLFAGFLFVKYSRITLAATALLAFAMLMTAGHSSYDPQLTNLQPVLKSYWLIIHVASITISYGFFGVGLFLGLINIFLYIFTNSRNFKKLDTIIFELTNVIEMNIAIGLALATMGTFLGGVWANESWGRYWGWDAKETWALIILIIYAVILHLRLIPKFKSIYIFNVSTIFAFGTVLMTFIGVNYYLTKGLHSYASDDTPVFPLWGWISILFLISIVVLAGIRSKKFKSNYTLQTRIDLEKELNK